ncbi:MAG: hypothetical protein EAZ84_03855 [Verrucomicrobia bacterium]|nr:MAG: hypothetical protein EAZ84_03855 [Verrucomicrobiota bacterium]TAE86541.1 MAG: hypothetical protein EAZ82_10970 [Verrucomicrobiota bacterium]TAF24236.1 MAG: hypothetical protein EAZ71_11745 [Verrucomicrobiota bacterium]
MNHDIPPSGPAMPQHPPVEAAIPEKLDTRALFEALLRSPRGLASRLAEPHHGALARFLAIALGSMLIFGLVLGSFAMNEQLWAAPLKITAGLLISGLICFPSLYIFSCLAGSRAEAGQVAALLTGMLALAGVLLLGFAPAVWIFTQATRSHGFMGFLALTPWLIALLFGLRFLRSAISATGASVKGPITLWAAIFLLVTLQMSTSLRPIIGRSERFLTDEKKFFLQHWIDSAHITLPANPTNSTP